MSFPEKVQDDGVNGYKANEYDGSAHVAPANANSANAEKGLYSGTGASHVVDGPGAYAGEQKTKRTLKTRHSSMIAIGGAIGTGLFIGSGSALSSGGPLGLWLGYTLMATMVYAMMIALGEMAALYPVAGAFTSYASRFVDPALGFAVGFNYWYSYAITIPTEVVAATIVISYWDSTTNAAVYITVLLVAIWFINFWGARAYGEAEFIFSSIKVVTIIGLIILGIVLMAGGGPNHDAIGFRYWRNPGPFAQQTYNGGDSEVSGAWGQFLAFWSVLVQAAFSFIGTEIIATTIGETANPRKAVPRAIKQVFYRLLFFYVVGTFIISVLVPYNSPTLLNAAGSGTATASPFVIAINNAGIKALPSIVNAVLLISAWSAGNSDLYASSRTLYALAVEGQAPAIFRKCTKRGLPIWCVVATGIFGVLAYMNTGGAAATTAFNWLYNLSAITGLLTWWAILVSYLRFYYGLKKQGISRADFPYRAPFQPYMSWYGLICFTLIIILNGYSVFLKGNWDVSTFFAAYITIPIFVLAYVIWKVVKKTKFVPLDEIDFEKDRREFDLMDEETGATQQHESKVKKFFGNL